MGKREGEKSFHQEMSIGLRSKDEDLIFLCALHMDRGKEESECMRKENRHLFCAASDAFLLLFCAFSNL